MTGLRVRLTKRALGHLNRIDAWWRDNRSAAADLFATEVETAFKQLADAPLAGVPYARADGRSMRRLLLVETRYHVYFDVDEDADEVVVLAVWHASRGRNPPIPR